jgi:hypothetical protein
LEAPRLTRASTVEGAKKRQSQATTPRDHNVTKEKLSLGSKRFSLKQSPEAASEDGSNAHVKTITKMYSPPTTTRHQLELYASYH